jgi:L-serine/L-threonine ammonia-lyase
MHYRTSLLPFLRSDLSVLPHTFIKMEAYQPSGSFKLRGIGAACAEYARRGKRHFYCPSGGNAGLAAAYAGRELGIPTTVIVPESANANTINRIKTFQAEVVQRGIDWNASYEWTLKTVENDPQGVLIHAFDDPLIWSGHATMIDECVADGVHPDLVILSVGGGGLMLGVLEGLARNGLSDCKVIAAETPGTCSLHRSAELGYQVTLDTIEGRATSLGARRVADKAFQALDEWNLTTVLIDETDALAACHHLLKTHRVAVEVACGVALAVPQVRPDLTAGHKNIVLIGCGGVSVESLWE